LAYTHYFLGPETVPGSPYTDGYYTPDADMIVLTAKCRLPWPDKYPGSPRTRGWRLSTPHSRRPRPRRRRPPLRGSLPRLPLPRLPLPRLPLPRRLRRRNPALHRRLLPKHRGHAAPEAKEKEKAPPSPPPVPRPPRPFA
jgi:hypothetical protein